MRRHFGTAMLVLFVLHATYCSAQITNTRYDTNNLTAHHYLHHTVYDWDPNQYYTLISDSFTIYDTGFDPDFANTGDADSISAASTTDEALVVEQVEASVSSSSSDTTPQTSANIGRLTTSNSGTEGSVWWDPAEVQTAVGYTKYVIANAGSTSGELDIELHTLVASDIDTFHELNASSDFGPEYGDYTYFFLGDQKLDSGGNVVPESSTWIYGCWTGTDWHVWWHLEQIGDDPIEGDTNVADISSDQVDHGYRSVEVGDKHQQVVIIHMERGDAENPKVSNGENYMESTGINISVITDAY